MSAMSEDRLTHNSVFFSFLIATLFLCTPIVFSDDGPKGSVPAPTPTPSQSSRSNLVTARQHLGDARSALNDANRAVQEAQRAVNGAGSNRALEAAQKDLAKAQEDQQNADSQVNNASRAVNEAVELDNIQNTENDVAAAQGEVAEIDEQVEEITSRAREAGARRKTAIKNALNKPYPEQLRHPDLYDTPEDYEQAVKDYNKALADYDQAWKDETDTSRRYNEIMEDFDDKLGEKEKADAALAEAQAAAADARADHAEGEAGRAEADYREAWAAKNEAFERWNRLRQDPNATPEEIQEAYEAWQTLDEVESRANVIRATLSIEASHARQHAEDLRAAIEDDDRVSSNMNNKKGNPCAIFATKYLPTEKEGTVKISVEATIDPHIITNIHQLSIYWLSLQGKRVGKGIKWRPVEGQSDTYSGVLVLDTRKTAFIAAGLQEPEQGDFTAAPFVKIKAGKAGRKLSLESLEGGDGTITFSSAFGKALSLDDVAPKALLASVTQGNIEVSDLEKAHTLAASVTSGRAVAGAKEVSSGIVIRYPVSKVGRSGGLTSAMIVGNRKDLAHQNIEAANSSRAAISIAHVDKTPKLSFRGGRDWLSRVQFSLDFFMARAVRLIDQICSSYFDPNCKAKESLIP